MRASRSVSVTHQNSRRIPAHGGSRTGRTGAILITLLALGGGGYLGYQQFFAPAPESIGADMVTATVMRGPFDHIVLEQGEVESSSNIEVVCEVKSRGSQGTPILWVIDEGAYVKEGDKLVEMDVSALENEIKTQRISVSSAEALVISSEATVRTAEIALQEYIQGTYLQERKAIESEIFVAKKEMFTAELKLDSARRLGAKGVIKKLQIDSEQFAVENAKNVLEASLAKLRVLDELTMEKNKVQFESDIEAAKARFRSDKSVLSEEQDKLTEIEDQIEKCVMYSPADGVVVHNNEFSRRGNAEFVVEEGAIIRERQTIIKLPDPTKMQVKANVNESRITLIREGMPAKIRVGAVPGEMLARVMHVNKYAEPGSWFSSAVKEYATIIEIIDPPENIRTGMTAEVRIFVEQLDNALQIPVHGIYEYKGRHFCLKKTGETLETVEVVINATNDKNVTIGSGLSEGDEIVLSPRSHLNLMELPEIEDVTDRDELSRLGAQPMPVDKFEDEQPAPQGPPHKGDGGYSGKDAGGRPGDAGGAGRPKGSGGGRPGGSRPTGATQ